MKHLLLSKRNFTLVCFSSMHPMCKTERHADMLFSADRKGQGQVQAINAVWGAKIAFHAPNLIPPPFTEINAVLIRPTIKGKKMEEAHVAALPE